MPIILDGTAGIDNDATDLSYTGTLTGGTGVVNLGSGQFYKDASGNVGIGTSSPGVKLDVNGNIRAQTGSFVGYTGTGGFTLLTTVAGSVVNGGALALRDASATYNTSGMEFYAGGSERARIDSSGNLLVGTTSTGFQNANNFTIEPQYYMVCNHSSARTSGSAYLLFGYNGSGIGSITQNGTTAVAYNTTSDYRLKENIQPMTGALAKVAALKPVTYKWKADGSDGEGFIAHELAEVCPAAVTGEKDAVDAEGKPQYQGIDTSFLVATLTAAIQEQQALIESLTARVVALEGQA